jgi:hypothetical protein
LFLAQYRTLSKPTSWCLCWPVCAIWAEIKSERTKREREGKRKGGKKEK